jgi:Flp pilus assembly protein TadG
MDGLSFRHRFGTLCQITRAQHFAWRQAVAAMFPDTDPARVVLKMWEVTGQQTAASYLKRLDPDQPLAPQVAQSIAWSSQCMGEDAEAVGRAWIAWSSFSGVIGKSRTRTPTASKMAFAMAGAVGTSPGSPAPLAPNGPSWSPGSTNSSSTGKSMSTAVGIL